MHPHPEDILAVTGRVSREQACEALTEENVKRKLYGADWDAGMDDMGEHAVAHRVSITNSAIDDLHRLAVDEENERRVHESAEHFRYGDIYTHGQMACATGDDSTKPLPWYTPHGVMAAASVGFVSVCVFLGYHVLPLIA